MSIEDQPRSVSQTEQYEKCAYRFYLQRVERVVPRPAAWSTQGTAFHSAAEAFEKSGRTATADEMVDLYSDLFSRKINGDLQKEPDLNRWLTAGPPAGEDIEARYKLGQQQVLAYVEWSTATQPQIWSDSDGWNGYDISDAPQTVTEGLELYFKVDIGGVPVRGYIDQLIEEPDGSVRVRDLKTGSTKSKFQIQTYKVAVEKIYGVKVNVGDWYLGKTGKLSPVRGVDLSEVTEEEVGARYAAMDAGVKAGNFPANPGFDCRFCDVSHACSFSRSKS
ncbi:PD-(D/E)XK nuclease family protein [Streptomyces sp. NBC_01500]|uniref:RecB family exonuclease n=1 Tax=Streptomyces sp. NBC_01500 TaxID=2903886 RepID=UPI00225C2028|nr:PD-(D/E)XK nuclease family protein [Streptomyces sp. NBC_01500]MCX4554122.1 PD-(D/E)XK nuclease family protein [Streptomyces sp. NBC_01500]